ncbi:hypothetical protein Lal_00016785 [Lupinus albus]|nr:hypothetical protein Lal_00016785 [Lupinus albus]
MRKDPKFGGGAGGTYEVAKNQTQHSPRHIRYAVMMSEFSGRYKIPPKPSHLEMILMDSKGDKIQVSLKKDEFNQWSQYLLENKTYIMHNFNVLRNDLQFKACDHFTAGTTLKQREFPDITELEYDFKKFTDIIYGNFRSDLLIDVIGVFDKLIFSQTQSNLKKVIFSMNDLFGDVISCTLWEAHVIKFLNYYNNQPSLQPLVILLTNARVKEGNYSPTVSNSWSGSKLLIDEEITNFQKYKDKFSNTQLSQYSSLSDDDHFLYKAVVKSINEISSLTSSEDMTCVTVGTTTMFVVGRQGWYYDGCAKCTNKTGVKDSPFTCKCGNFNQISIPRYKLEIKDRQCADLIGISASELKNQMLAEGEDDPKAFPLVLDELLAKTIVLRSVSMTADHDPEQFQVVTSSKRLSAEFDLDLQSHDKMKTKSRQDEDKVKTKSRQSEDKVKTK